MLGGVIRQPQMPPLGGEVASQPYTPQPPRVVTRTSPLLVVAMLVVGAVIGGAVVYVQMSARDIQRVEPTPTVSEGPPPIVLPPPPPLPPPQPAHAAGGAPELTVESDGIPDSIDRQMIVDAVARVKPAIVACGDRYSTAKGKVRLHVGIAPAGTVGDIIVKESPDAALGECVAAAMRKLVFPTSKNGGSFGYPFVF